MFSGDQAPVLAPGLCLHCLMVQMGDMVCYQQLCPHCGRVPPGRNTLAKSPRQEREGMML